MYRTIDWKLNVILQDPEPRVLIQIWNKDYSNTGNYVLELDANILSISRAKVLFGDYKVPDDEKIISVVLCGVDELTLTDAFADLTNKDMLLKFSKDSIRSILKDLRHHYSVDSLDDSVIEAVNDKAYSAVLDGVKLKVSDPERLEEYMFGRRYDIYKAGKQAYDKYVQTLEVNSDSDESVHSSDDEEEWNFDESSDQEDKSLDHDETQVNLITNAMVSVVSDASTLALLKIINSRRGIISMKEVDDLIGEIQREVFKTAEDCNFNEEVKGLQDVLERCLATIDAIVERETSSGKKDQSCLVCGKVHTDMLSFLTM